MHRAAWCVLAGLAIGCGAKDVGDDDTDAGDDTDVVVDTDVADTDTDLADSDVDSDTFSDTFVDGDTGTAPDTDVVDTDACGAFAGDTSVEGCAYQSTEEVMAVCHGLPVVAYHLGDPLVPTCDAWWDVEGTVDPDLATALECAECDRSCVYRANTAVMVLYCDTRGEYIVWRSGGPAQTGLDRDCEDWIEGHTVAGSGWYRSWAEYQAAHPCPTP